MPPPATGVTVRSVVDSETYIGKQERPAKVYMRTDSALWMIWFVWVLWILAALYPDASVIKWGVLLVTCGVLILFLKYLLLKRLFSMRLLKRGCKAVVERAEERTPVENAINTPTRPAVSPSVQVEGAEMIKPIRTRKDTFISPEAQLAGNLEGQGNIVIEGQLNGNIRSLHQVRIESGGLVVGDIHAEHIVINGRGEGRFYANAITLQSEGHIQGDIFTDVLIIEKGGVFIGQSQLQLKPQEEVVGKKGNVTALTLPVVQDTSTHTG